MEYLSTNFGISNKHVRTDEPVIMLFCVFMLTNVTDEISNTKVETSEILEHILLKKRWIEMNKLKF
jgi:hypothetical protein